MSASCLSTIGGTRPKGVVSARQMGDGHVPDTTNVEGDIFVVSWIGSVLIYRAKRFDELEVSR